MIIIPGWLIGLVTFPGVIVHEAAHLFFCKLRRVAVFDVCFFVSAIRRAMSFTNRRPVSPHRF